MSNVGDEEASGEVEGVGDSSNEHLILDFPLAGGSIDSGEDECQIADCDIGGPNNGEVSLLVYVSNDGED